MEGLEGYSQVAPGLDEVVPKPPYPPVWLSLFYSWSDWAWTLHQPTMTYAERRVVDCLTYSGQLVG